MIKKIISCPKCDFEQESSDECVNCGIIFNKIRNRTDTTAGTPANAALSRPEKNAGMPGGSFRLLRILILLLLLFFVVMSAVLTKIRSTDWDQPLRVVVYPINGDKSSAASEYIASLKKESFVPIEDFMRQEAEQYELALDDPVTFRLAPEVKAVPPKPPQGGNLFNVIWWSLQLRYWSCSVDTYDGPSADIRMFVVYFDPRGFQRLDDSLGLQKGLIGVVYAYASRKLASKDNVVITHELLHTLGATDKYDPASRQPVHPDGFAEPGRHPLFPQEMAAVMGTRIPLSKTSVKMPEGLDEVVIGEKTAREIKWVE